MTDIVGRLHNLAVHCTILEYDTLADGFQSAAAEIEHLRLSISEARATGRREGMEERRLCAIDLWNQLVVLSGYHITRPPTPDHEFVQVCNGDLRKMIELMGRMYQPTTVGEQRPDNLDVDRFSYAIRAAMEKADNSRDMVERGRCNKRDQSGENNGASKLTNEQIEIIRRRIARGETNVRIAKDFGVTHSMISRIRRGKAWSAIKAA